MLGTALTVNGKQKTFAIYPVVFLLLPLSAGCGGSNSGLSDSGTSGASAGGAASSGGASAGSSGAPSGGGASGTSSTTAGASGTSSAGASSGGSTGTAGTAATAGSSGSTAGSSGSTGTAGTTGTPSTEKFSFFVTSLAAMQALSGSAKGFGGDLRYGETGTGAGLRGADKICKAVAERSMAGNNKTWHAFLSVTDGGDGKAVNAIDRVGAGPWYDRTGRLVANTVADLANTRPKNAATAISNDLPNEDGVPNHTPDPTQAAVDNHDTMTGSDATGKLYSTDLKATCMDWTTAEATTWGAPRCGHSWPRTGMGGMGGGNMNSWISALDESGCGAGVHITTFDDGPPSATGTTVGDGGGYGGFYCFALTP